MRSVTLFILILFFLACGQSTSSENEKKNTTPEFSVQDTIDEETLIAKLSTALSSDTGRVGQERNTIVNFLIDQGKDMDHTNSGLFYKVYQEGNGELLQWADYIKVDYKGYFLDGKVFDSSYERGEPISFYIGNMVDGWNEGLQLLSPGAKASFIVPSHLGYGEKGFPLSPGKFLVPPNTIIAFDVEVLEKLPDPNK